MTGWLGEDRSRVAAERILDAAAALFVDRGVTGVGMGEVARAAGCSRATLYRYFADRHELRLAYVHREARRVGAQVAREVAGIEDRAERLAAALLTSVRRVRATPALAAWFASADAATTAALAQSSEVITGLAGTLVDDEDDARWLVRVVVSLLAVPGRDEADERRQVERYVVPALVRPAAGRAGAAPRDRRGARSR